MLDQCENVKILCTSRTLIDKGDSKVGNIQEAIIYLKELPNQYSVRLFLKKAEIDINKKKDKE